MTIHWDLPPGEGWKFRVLQAQVLRPTETEPLRKVWVPYAYTNVVIDGRTASAKIEGLIPGRGVNFALQTVAPDGKKSFPGKYIVVMTLIPPPSRWEWWVGGGLVLLLLGWWLWRKWKEPINRNI